MFSDDMRDTDIARTDLEIAASKASHDQLIVMYNNLLAERDELLASRLPDDYIAAPASAWHEMAQYEMDLQLAKDKIKELESKIKSIDKKREPYIYGQCIACGGNHGGLQCPQMAITGKLEG